MNITSFRLYELISDIKDIIETQAELKGIKFNVKVNFSKQKDDITSSREKIMQLLLNILTNALKFSLKGHISMIIQKKVLE